MVVLISSVAIYFATKSDVVIGIAKPVDLSTQMYTEQIILSFGKELTDKQEKQLTEMVDEIEKAQIEISTELVAPTHIEIEVEFEDGKTIITYSGKATQKATNNKIDYKKELVFDFILTREVSED
jgi:ABC-type sugar transport system ATPase subunit